MFRNNVNRKWARKLMQSRNFVVLTDTESVVCFAGLDPTSFEDTVMLMSQKASLVGFKDRVEQLIKEHDRAAARMKGVNGKKRTQIKVR